MNSLKRKQTSILYRHRDPAGPLKGNSNLLESKHESRNTTIPLIRACVTKQRPVFATEKWFFL